MNAKKFLAAVAVLAAANTAFATEWVEFSDFKSTKTRAEVIAELKQAKSDGSYAVAQQEFDGQVPGQAAEQATRLAGDAKASAN